MFKMILKKLVLTAAFFVLWFVTVYVGSFILVLLKKIIPLSPAASTVIVCCMYAIASIVLLYFLKLRNQTKKENYFLFLDSTTYSFRNNILYTIKSNDFLAGLTALNCLLVPIELANTSIIRTLLFFIAQSLLFVLLDCSLDLIVFSKWQKT